MSTLKITKIKRKMIGEKYTNSKYKRARVAILTSNKIDFKTKKQ